MSTPNLALDVLTTGQSGKEVAVNASLGQIDGKLTTIVEIDCSTSGQAPTLLQMQRNLVVRFKNVTGSYTVPIPTFTGAIVFEAAAANTHVVTITRGTATMDISPGKSVPVYLDGSTNFMQVYGGGGLPPGGTTGQALVKTSGADGAADWETPASGAVPTGGTTGQVLTKLSGTDYDTDWSTPTGGGGGGGGTTTACFDKLAPPMAADFTPASGTTLADTDHGLKVVSDTGPQVWGNLLKSRPSGTSWTITAGIEQRVVMGNYPGMGIYLFDSTGLKGIWCGVQYGGSPNITVQHLNNNAYDSNPLYLGVHTPPKWFRIVNDAGTLHFLFSWDHGETWFDMENESLTGWASAIDKVGVYVYNTNSAVLNAKNGGDIFYWLEEPSTANYFGSVN